MSQKVIQDIQMGDVKGSVSIPAVVQYVASTLKVGKVEEGDTASVENVGTPQHAVFDFVIPKGAYKTAVDGGYTGTQQEFNEDLANFKELSQQAQDGAQTATEKANAAAQSAIQAESAMASASQSAETATQKAAEAAQSAIDAAEAAQNLSQATESKFGVVKLATLEEAESGTDDTKAMTPAKTKVLLDKKANADNVFTKDNLLGGQDITIDEELPSGGIDQYTLGCWHFDTDKENAVADGQALSFLSGVPKVITSDKKFGAGSLELNYPFYISSSSLGAQDDWTIDFWAKNWTSNGTNQSFSIGTGAMQYSYGYFNISWSVEFNKTINNKVAIYNTKHAAVAEADCVLPVDTWYHIAVVRKGNTLSAYLNGTKVISYTDASIVNQEPNIGAFVKVCNIDELRISNIARYNGDFTPATEAYRVAQPTGNYQINYDRTYLDNKLASKADLVNGTVPTEQIPALPYLPTSGGTVEGDISANRVISKTLLLGNSTSNETYIDLYGNLYIKNLSSSGNPSGIVRYAGTGYSQRVLWSSDKGVADGVASLGSDGKVPAAQLPEALTNAVAKTGDEMTGALKVPTPASTTNDTTVPTTEWVRALLSFKSTGTVTIAQGGTSIASDYILTNLPEDNLPKLAFINCSISLSGDGSTSLAVSSTLCDTIVVCQTNNGFRDSGFVLLPIGEDRKISLSFPVTAGGLQEATVKLLGYI